MENAPEAAGVAPAPQTEATPINTNEPVAQPAQEMYGFTSEQLADMRRFYDANGGYDKVKSKISNPTPVQPEVKPVEPEQTVAQPQAPVYRAPEGSITTQEWMAKEYFRALSGEERYASISNEIASGELLKEMASFNIQALNQDGSINDGMVRRYLDLKAQTVPAKQTSVGPEASAAPTVDYIPVGETITDINQAYDIIRQDAMYKSRGIAGHPSVAKAEEFIKNSLSNK